MNELLIKVLKKLSSQYGKDPSKQWKKRAMNKAITSLKDADFEIKTGYFLSQQEEWDLNKKLKEIKNQESDRSSQSSSLTSRLILLSNLNSCGCC